MEPPQAKARPQKPEAAAPPSEVPKIPSIFVVEAEDYLKRQADEKKPAPPLRPPPELQKLYDDAPHYFPGRRTDLAIEGATVEQVKESLQQSAIENRSMLLKAYKEHMLAPLKHKVHSKLKFSTEDYTRAKI